MGLSMYVLRLRRLLFFRTMQRRPVALLGAVALLFLLTFSSFSFAQAPAQEGEEKKPKPRPKNKIVDSVAEALAEQRKAIPRAAFNQYRKTIPPAIEARDDLAFLQAMEAIVSQRKPETIEKLEAFARANGLGSLRQRFTQLLVESIEQGVPVRPAAMKPQFVQWATGCLLEKIESELVQLDKHVLMQDPLELPEDWRDAEQLFWDVHVWKNRMLNMDELVKYVVAMQKPHLDRATRKKDQEAIDALQAPLEIVERVASRHREMVRREIELRFVDLDRAEEVLRLERDFEMRLTAAFVLAMQGGELNEFFKDHPPGDLIRESLSEGATVEKAELLVKAGHRYGADVIEKAVLLRGGAHWWLRGRYGMAAMAKGLLKPPAAMTNRYLMEGLFMPTKRPPPIGAIETESGQESPGYDRRHHYTWAIEVRDVSVDASRSTDSDASVKRVGGLTTNTFW